MKKPNAPEPPFSDQWAYEYLGNSAQIYLPVIIEDWRPPGGRDADPAPLPLNWLEFDERHFAAFLIVVSKRLVERLEVVCPPEANALECSRGVAAEQQRLADLVEGFGSDDPLDTLRLNPRDERAREQLYTKGMLNGISSYQKYIQRNAFRLFDLAAIRLHVHIRLTYEVTGPCFRAETLWTDEWLPLFTDPNTGLPMRVFEAEKGSFEIAPSYVFREVDDYHALRYRITCPAAASEAP